MKRVLLLFLFYAMCYEAFSGTAVTQKSWQWRKDDGSETTATARAGQDESTSFTSKDEVLRLRLGFIINPNSIDAISKTTSQLAYSTDPDGPFIEINSTIGENNHFIYAASSNFTQGAATTKKLVYSTSDQFKSGQMFESESGTITFDLPDTESSRIVEYEWSIKATEYILPNTTYYFILPMTNSVDYSYSDPLPSIMYTPPAEDLSVTSITRGNPTAALTNKSSVAFTLVMNTAVTGLSASNLSLTTTGVTGASITNVTGSGTTYTVAVNTGTGDGTIRLDMNNSTGVSKEVTEIPVEPIPIWEVRTIKPLVTPVVASAFPYTSGEVYTIDKTGPTPTISSTASNPTSNSVIPVKIDFDESVTGFTVSDVTVSGGTKSNFAGSGKNYTLDVTASQQGTVTVNVGAEVALDAAGNENKQATQYSVSYSTTSIAVTSITRGNPTAALTNKSSVAFTLVMNTAVTGLSASNLSLTTTGVTGASITNLTGSGTTYTVTVNTGTGDGTIRLDMNNSTGVSKVVIIDGRLANRSATILAVPSAFPYTSGEVYTIDKTAPTPTISSTASNPTSTSVIPVKIDFSENVTGFTVSDVTVSGGTKSNFAGSGKNYTLDVTASQEGTITVDVNIEVALDAAGNENKKATQYSIEYSTGSILVSSITRKNPTAALTNKSSVEFKLVMNRAVTGLSASNLSLTTTGVSGASITNVAGDDDTYTVTVNTGTGDGTIRLDMDDIDGVSKVVIIPVEPIIVIPSDNVRKPKGAAIAKTVLGASAFPYTSGEVYTIDKTAPTPTISSTASNPTSNNVIPIKIDFSESVTGFTVGDVTVSGGTKSNFSGSGSNYTLDVTASQEVEITVDVNMEVALDAAGNENKEATQFSINYSTGPILVTSINRKNPEAELTNASSVNFELTLNKSVTGLSTSNLALTTTGVADASITNVTGSGAVYTVTVNTGSGDGTIRLDMDNETDLIAGVPIIIEIPQTPFPFGAAAFPYTSGQSYTIDKTAPVPTISSLVNSPAHSTPINVKIDFSEDVFGFEVEDITVLGATKGTLSGSGANYSLDITPTAEGTITVNVGAEVSEDEAGNYNLSATQFSIAYEMCEEISIESQPVNATICKGSDASFTVDVISDEITYQWQVDHGDGFTDIENNENYEGSTTSTLEVINPTASFEEYTYRVIMTNNCEEELTSENVQLSFIVVNPPVVVSGSRVGNGTVTLSATGSTDGHYNWYTSNGTIIEGENNGTYITSELEETTTYYVSISMDDCKSEKVEVVAQIKSVPPVITANQSFDIAENSANGTSIGTVLATDEDGSSFSNWTIVSGNDAGAFALDPATGVLSVKNSAKLDFEATPSFALVLTVSDGENTSLEQTVVVKVTDVTETGPEIFIPTAFSPNGDNVNDTWELKGLDYYTESVVKIFNTDGHEVFSNKGYTEQWDGTHKGKEMNLGTFYYIIKLNDGSNKIYKGNIMIID